MYIHIYPNPCTLKALQPLHPVTPERCAHPTHTGEPRSQETAPPLGPYGRPLPKAIWRS